MASTLVVCVEHLHKYMKTDWYNCYLSLPFFLPLKLSKSMFLRLYCSFRSIGWTGRNNLPMFSLLTVQRVDRKEHLEEIKAAWVKKWERGRKEFGENWERRVEKRAGRKRLEKRDGEDGINSMTGSRRMRVFSPKRAVSFYRRSKDTGVWRGGKGEIREGGGPGRWASGR